MSAARRNVVVIAATIVLLVVMIAVVTIAGVTRSGHGVTAARDRAPSAPAHLTVDDDAAPLAVEGPPRFGWVVVDADRGEVQRAYELLVATAPTTDPGARAVVWASGRVASGTQSYVTAPSGALRLEPDHSYYWTVRTWDRAGRAGPFAAPARFDTGLADGDWHADWVRRPSIDPTASEDFTLARTELRLAASPVVRARVYISAGQQYDLRVNGVRVAHGPSFAYPDDQYYDAVDITSALHAGAVNGFGVVAHWETPGQGRPASVPGLIARITVQHADGAREVAVTDGDWRVHRGPWVAGPLRNSEGDHVEHIDARLEPVGWDRPGFDDASWPHAAVVGPHPTAPFLHLRAARSHIVEHGVAPRTLARVSGGAYVADFGSVIAATPVVELHAGVAGRAVKLVAGYLLDPDGHVSTTRGTQETDMHWDYDERAGAQEIRPFDYLGFRYLEVDGAAEPLSATDVTVSARHASQPDEHASSLRTSNPAIDAVWNLAVHSALYDTQEQMLDTPTREKGAFMNPLGDSRAAMFAFGERAITAESLADFAASQARYWPDGRVNVVYPNGDGGRDIPDSTEGYVEWIWRVYMTDGDREQLAALYPVVRNIAAYVARAIDPHTGLVTHLPGGGGDYLGGIVDWPPNMRYGYDVATAARTTESVLAVDVFRRVAAMADALHRPAAEASAERALAARVTAAIQGRVSRADGVLVDGLEADGRPSTHASQLANAMALEYGVVPREHVGAVVDYVISRGNAVGVPTTEDLLYGLHAAGRDDAMVPVLTDASRPGYAHILAEGATFTWEAWDARQTGDSESHGWGAAVIPVLVEDFLGVTVTSPGAAAVDVHVPSLGDFSASGVVATQRGAIDVAWTRRAGRVTLDVSIPANVVATVELPSGAISAVRESGRVLAGDPGVRSARPTTGGVGGVTVAVGSGRYSFVVAG